MRKKIIIILSVLLILIVNQCYYLTSLQFKCTDKINNGRELNLYETVSALQTHTAFWLFGWVIEPQTALTCFYKQFHIYNPPISIAIPDLNDPKLVEARNKLLSKKTEKVRLTWEEYTTRNSILLNGSTVQKFWDDGIWYFMYEIPLDYKPGLISIHRITISETVFDYLENKGLLSVFTISVFQKMK